LTFPDWRISRLRRSPLALLIFSFCLLTGFHGPVLAGHFPDPPASTYGMTITGHATLNGAPLAAGDEIAAWSVHPSPGGIGKWERTLVGRVLLDGPAMPGLPVGGDDDATAGVVEGAAVGEELCLVLWRASEGREYTAYRTPAGDPLSIAYAGDFASLDVDVDFTQGIRVPLLQGSWNLVSAPLLSGWKTASAILTAPQLPGAVYDNVAAMGDAFPLRSIAGRYDRVIGNDGGGVRTWEPARPAFSTLGALQPGYGYWIRTKAASQPLLWMTFPGTETSGAETLSLEPGWKLLGFWKGRHVYHEASVTDPSSLLLPPSVTDNQAVASIGELWAAIAGRYSRVIAFDRGARIWNPAAPGLSTLRYLAAGSGYWVKVGSPAEIDFAVAVPTLTPPPGTYVGAQSVTLASATSGASIRYTLDNTAPTATRGTLYAGPIPVDTDASVSIRAVAYKAGEPDSKVSGGTWRVTGSVAEPHFSLASGTYQSAQWLSLSTTTPGASIRYTTDGSQPTSTRGTPYVDPIPLDSWSASTIRAIAFRDGWLDSPVSSGTFTILGTVAFPVMSPDPQSYVDSVVVTISTATPGATIRYTTDGSTPGITNGYLYAGPFTVSRTTNLRAIAYRSGWSDSPVAAGRYLITGTVAKPVFDLSPGTYTSERTVAITTPTPWTVIRYTTDGTPPSSTWGTQYFGPIALPPDSTTNIRAIAFRESWTDSEVASGTFRITGTVATPVFNLPPGSYSNAQFATISSATAGAAIRYTTDGTPPTPATGTLYTEAIPLPPNSVHTIRAIAARPEWIDSATSSGTYAIAGQVSTPTASPIPGAYSGTLAVTLGTATPDAAIRYTTDGSTPSPTNGTVYADPIRVPADPAGATIRAIATRDGWTDSGIFSGSYSTRMPVAIAAGMMHSLMLRADGTVCAWGWNYYGEVGDGTTTKRKLAVDVAGLTDVVAIAAGRSHSVALKRDGTVWTWGLNSDGQLGDGSTTQRNAPVRVQGLDNVVAISAGYYHTLALTADNAVWAWGANGTGQLGDGTLAGRVSPVQVRGLGGVAEVSGGANFSVARMIDGTVRGWGRNAAGQLGDNTTADRYLPVQALGMADVVSLSAGSSHAACVKSDGTVWVWGDNYYHQVGNTGLATFRNVPGQVTGFSGAARVEAGAYHTLILKGDRTVWAWGDNQRDQLGDESYPCRTSPAPVPVPAGIVEVAGGLYHSLALGGDGTLWAWGSNSYMELGDGTTVSRANPVVSGGNPPVAVSAGASHSVLVKRDGTAWSWGSNRSGQLGEGTAISRTTPIQVPGIVGATAAAAGGSHTLVLRSDGTVWAWGANDYGQLGDGSRAYRTTPVQVAGLTGVVAIAAGRDHSAAVLYDNTAWTWGRNDRGQLGDKTRIDRDVPIAVQAGTATFVAVAAGATHTLALSKSGVVYASGGNANGQLGDGGLTDRDSFEPASNTFGLTGATAIAAGEGHSLALLGDGTLYSWGANGYGQLGNGTTTDLRLPTPVSGLASVLGIAAGDSHTVAVRYDGLWAWGRNAGGQLGDGTTQDRTAPRHLSLTKMEKAVAGAAHTIGLRQDGSVWTWGGNPNGELGDGTTTPRTTPGRI
jgi:alpha-tubulin suppressor-like RCC1 family protein